MKLHLLWIPLTWIVSLLFGCSDSSYYKKDGKWHYDGVPMEGVNEPVKLKVIDRHFAKDERTGFYKGNRIYHGNEASDGATFEVLNRWYAKDKFRVYYCDSERDSKEYWSVKRTAIQVLAEADPATFRMMADGYTPRDKAHVFYRADVVAIRDVESYELLENEFSKDKLSAYYRGIEMVGSDAATFTVLDMHYAKDRARVYYVQGFKVGGTIRNVRLASFKTLADGYASDGASAFYKGAVMTRQHADSLVSLKHMGYAKTQSQVFHYGKLMQGADAESFAVAEKFDPTFDASDKVGQFRAGERVKGSQ